MHNAAMFSVPLSNKQWIMEPYQRKKAGEMRDRDAPNDTGINVRISSGPEFTSLRPFPKLVKCHVSRPCTSKNSVRHNSWEDGIFWSIPKIDIRYFLWESFWDVYGYLGWVRNKGHFNAMRERYHYTNSNSYIKSSFFSIKILFPTHLNANPPQEIAGLIKGNN